MKYFFLFLFLFYSVISVPNIKRRIYNRHRYKNHVLHSLLQVGNKLMSGCTSQIDSMCDPCFRAPLTPLCDRWKTACKDSICSPMCTRLTWDVEVTPKSCSGNEKCTEFMNQINSEQYQLALKAHLIAHGCAHILQCCPENEKILNWVEHRVYGGYFPSPLLPIPSCSKPSSDLCTMCKSAVSVSASVKDSCGDFTHPPEPPPASYNANFAHSFVIPMSLEKPKHKSYQEKCEKIKTFVQGKLSSMNSEFSKGVCDCLGCCTPSDPSKPCFFPGPVYTGIEDAKTNSPAKF